MPSAAMAAARAELCYVSLRERFGFTSTNSSTQAQKILTGVA